MTLKIRILDHLRGEAIQDGVNPALGNVQISLKELEYVDGIEVCIVVWEGGHG